MTQPEFEFLGNARYIKYRLVQETAINITTIEESWESENYASYYNITEDYLKRSLNIKSVFEGHEVSYFNISKMYTEPDFFKNANIIQQGVSSLFFDGRQKYFSPSPVLETARTIIISGPPKRIVSTSLSFLNMDGPVMILTVSTVVFLSLLLVFHSIVTNKYKWFPTKKIAKKLAHETLKNVWENASILCAEPILAVLPHITCRLLTSSWLIGVTFILFFLGCYLRTEFTTESYRYIDTLSDLIKSGIPPTMMKESGTLDYLKYLATEDPVVKEWLDGLDQEKLFTTFKDYSMLEGYIPILSGQKALIVVETYMRWTIGEFFTSDSESKRFLAENGGLYFSQQEVSFDYLHLIFNASWIRSSPQLAESLQISFEPMFETQFFKYVDLQLNRVIDQVMWKRPLKSTMAVDFSSVFVPFYLLLMLLSGTVAVVITEILFYQFA